MSRHLYNLRITRIIHLFRRVSRSPLLIRHSFTPIYTTQGTLMCSSSNSHSIFSHSKHKTAVSADENDFWEPVYRLHPIVFIQAVSRFKLLLSGIMLIGCPVTIYGYVNNLLSLSFIYSFLGSAIFSSCTLLVYSLISTKVVGVVSIHKESGLIRIGYLTFWGKRRNAILSADQIIPPSDINDEPEKNKSVRFGIVPKDIQCSQSSTIKQTFILTKVKSEIIDKEKFRHIFGFTW